LIYFRYDNADGAYLMTKGGEMMKKLISYVLVALLALSFAACAPMKKDTVRVKCPACGYEFDAPMGGE
jgi:hypothetical protein